VRLHEPIEVAALFDSASRHGHLKNSGEIIMKYEKDNPQTSAMLQAFARRSWLPNPSPPPVSPSRCLTTSAT